MPSIFTRIINGELPGRFVYKDDKCVAFLSICPLKPGHTLVVPRQEVDHWVDLDPELAAHLIQVAQKVGKAIQHGFHPAKVGISVVGLEVHHVHFHLVPISDVHDMDFERQERNPKPEDLDAAAQILRSSLRELGYEAAE